MRKTYDDTSIIDEAIHKDPTHSPATERFSLRIILNCTF